jgi:hypothetical protein
MAFQSGTQIRPELGNADFSGFARAAEIRGAAMANLGQQIGQGIEKYKKNKEITATTLASVEGSVAANPQYLETALAQGGKIAKAAQKLQDGDINRMDLLTLEGYFSTLNKVSQAKAAEENARLEREYLIARTGASERSNRPTDKPVTYSQIKGLSQLMEEQFSNVKVDESTGETYMKVPKTGDYIPFNKERVPANIPDAIKNMPGFEEWKKSKMSPSSQRDYSSLGMSVVK